MSKPKEETRTQTARTVRFYWRTGDVDEAKGWGNASHERAADAANRLGYGGGAIAALDYWKELPSGYEGEDLTLIRDAHKQAILAEREPSGERTRA